MTTEELTEIKAAAERIHAEAVKAGRWNPMPAWEAKLMDIVCDISRAAEADKKGRHADLSMFDFYVPKAFDNKAPGEPFGTFASCYESFVQGTPEDCLADAVIDILDTAAEYTPDWYSDREEILRGLEDCHVDGDAPFPMLCYHLTGLVVYYDSPYCPELFSALELLRQWSEAHGVDLRRHVELKIKYNEQQGRRS